MTHALAQLEIYRETLATNEPIHRAEGNIAQADLELEALKDTEDAIFILKLASRVHTLIGEL